MAKRFVVDLLNRSTGKLTGTRAEFDSATAASEYMDCLDLNGEGLMQPVCWLENVPEAFEATTERLLARIMDIAD